jgi:phenylacetate-CoA ligase
MTDSIDQFLKALARTERLPPRELARYQEQLLIPLVRHASDRLPFYRNRLGCLFTADQQIDLSRWNDVPLLTREDVVAHGHEMRVPDLAADYGEIAQARTSGSTGVPLEIATNGLVFFATNALLTRAAQWWGVATSRPAASIRRFINEPPPPSPEGSVTKGWSLADPDAPLYELDMMTPVARQLEWLAARKAPHLFSQASGVLAIAHAVTPEQGRALGIETVFLTGETIPDGTREIVAERLGARLAGLYSCREIGMIATECERAPHYHVAVENALVEIVDDHGRDVAPGERGRVVVTGLYNYVMPFIRYQLGDIAVAGAAPCPCGRTLPIIARIDGRTRSAFVFRDGSRMWPRAAMINPMQAFVPFQRFQLIQLDHERIEFQYISDGSNRQPDLAGLNAYARQIFHPSVEFSAVEVSSFAPAPSGKFEQFISHVASPVTPSPRPERSPRDLRGQTNVG